MSEPDRIRERVEQLSRDARVALAERIASVTERPNPAVQLVAWVVPGPSSEGSPEDILVFLRNQLPEHTVPARLILLDRLPRLPNGKIDIAALPDARPGDIRPDGESKAPATGRERVLASIWSQVLGADRIDASDNFFELGGDSILSIQVVARARSEGLILTPDMVFEHQTLSALAAAATLETRPGEAGPSGRTARVTPAQIALIQGSAAMPVHRAVVLEFRQDLDAHRFQRAIVELCRRHDALRLRISSDGDGWTQELSDQAPVAVELSAHENASADEIIALLPEMHPLPSLEKGPNFRAFTVRTGGEARYVVLTADRLVMDRMSWDIVLDDLHELYAGRAEPVDEEQTPFLAACLALVQQGGGVQPEADTATTARSSSARPSGSAVESRVRHSFSVQLDAVRTEALLEDVHGPYNTRLEDFLVAALLRAADIVLRDRQVDTLIVRDGRSEWSIPRDQSRVVGCFARTVPLSVELPDPADHASTIRLTKDALRAALQGPPAPAARMQTPDPAQPSLEIVAAFGGFDASHSEPDNWRVARPLCYLGAETHAPHCVEVFSTVQAGSLHIHWSAGADWTRPDLDRLAARHLDEVGALITHAQSMRSRGFTPGDFPDAGLTQEQLDRFLGGLGE